MLKPTKYALLILELVRAEALRAGWYGAKIRVARQLGVSKQAVDCSLARHRHRMVLLAGVDRQYGRCRVCGSDYPAGFGRLAVCRDCVEQRLRRCACGAVGRWPRARCPACQLEIQRKFHTRHPGYQRRYRKTRGTGKKTRGVISR